MEEGHLLPVELEASQGLWVPSDTVKKGEDYSSIVTTSNLKSAYFDSTLLGLSHTMLKPRKTVSKANSEIMKIHEAI